MFAGSALISDQVTYNDKHLHIVWIQPTLYIMDAMYYAVSVKGKNM